MSDVIRNGRQEPLLPGVTARSTTYAGLLAALAEACATRKPMLPILSLLFNHIEQAERDLDKATELLERLSTWSFGSNTEDGTISSKHKTWCSRAVTPPPAAEALAAALHEAGRYGIWPHGTTVHVTGQCGTCDSFARWLMSQPALAGSLTRDDGLREPLERLRAFVIEQGIRGGPPIEVVGRIAAEIDREQARAALASGEEQ